MNDLTKGSILRHILTIAAFITLSMLFQAAYFLVDVYFVSALGPAALAGVSAGGAAMYLAMAGGQMVSVGALSLMGRAAGAKDQATLESVFSQGLSMSLAASIIAGILGYGLGYQALAAVTADEATRTAAWSYLSAYLPCLIISFPMSALGAGLRSVGIVGAPTTIQVASVALNAILAPVLIAGWGTGYPMGPFGAGLASTISALFASITAVILFGRMQSALTIEPARLRPNFHLWGQLLAIGVPAAGEFMILFVILAGSQAMIRQFGSDAQAGFGLGSRVMQAIIMPAMAIAFSLTPIVAQNLGAQRPDRVRRAVYLGLVLQTSLMLVLLFVCRLAPEQVLKVFNDNPAVVAVGVGYLTLMALNFPASGLVFTASGLFQALGSTRLGLFGSLTRVVTYMVPGFWIASQPRATIEDIWHLSNASVIIQALVVMMLLRRELRIKLGSMPKVLDQPH
jgi:putative MATE family efflux protein